MHYLNNILWPLCYMQKEKYENINNWRSFDVSTNDKILNIKLLFMVIKNDLMK